MPRSLNAPAAAAGAIARDVATQPRQERRVNTAGTESLQDAFAARLALPVVLHTRGARDALRCIVEGGLNTKTE